MKRITGQIRESGTPLTLLTVSGYQWEHMGFTFIAHKDRNAWWRVVEVKSGLFVPCHPDNRKDHDIHDTRKLAIDCARQTMDKVGKEAFSDCVKKAIRKSKLI